MEATPSPKLQVVPATAASATAEVADVVSSKDAGSGSSSGAGGAAAVRELLLRFQQLQRERAGQYAVLHEAFKLYLSSQQEGVYNVVMAEVTARFQACSLQVIAMEAELRQALCRPDAALMLRAVQEGERDKLRLTLTLQALRLPYSRKAFSWQWEDELHLLGATHHHPPQQQMAQQQHSVEAGDQLHPGSSLEGLNGNGVIAPGNQGDSSAAAAAAGCSSDEVSTEAAVAAPSTDGDPYMALLQRRQCCSHSHALNPNSHETAPHQEDEHDAAPEPTSAEYHAAVQEATQLLDAAVRGINDALEEVRYALDDLQQD